MMQNMKDVYAKANNGTTVLKNAVMNHNKILRAEGPAPRQIANVQNYLKNNPN